MQRIHVMFALTIVTTMAGCAVAPLKDAPTAYSLNVERQKIRSGIDPSHSDHPGLCLSFSGGGVRSGIFAAGVISALAERGALERVDVMAGASGGSWGMYWFYDIATNAKSWTPQPGVFAEDSSNAKHLFKNVDLLKLDVVGPYAAGDSLFFFNPWGASKSRSANQFVYQRFTSTYAAMIEDAFSRDHVLAVHPNAPTWLLLRDAVERRRVPLPVVTLTATPGTAPQQKPYDRSLANYFELTPFGFGGPAMGEISQDWRRQGWASNFKKLSFAVAISGAAVDAPNAKDLLSTDLIRVGGAVSFAPDTNTPRDFYLSDGGFTDNLAVYPNVLRQCSEIVIADATQDPSLQYSDLASTQHLLSQAGYELKIEGVDPKFRECDMHIDLHNVADRTSCQPSAPNAWMRSKRSSFSGTITGPNGYQAKITLLKLAAFADDTRWSTFCEDLGATVCPTQPVMAACSGVAREETCWFPYESTMQQKMMPNQALGYFRLGRDATLEAF
jgi:hypothetical protein